MSESYKELKARHQKEVDEFPFGFAFSNEQFEEMMNNWGLNPKKDKGEIRSIGCGGFVRKSDSDAMHEMFNRHTKELDDAIANDETGEGFIYEMFLYEMYNHEYGYTHDPNEVLTACGISRKELENDERLMNGFIKAQKEVFNCED